MKANKSCNLVCMCIHIEVHRNVCTFVLGVCVSAQAGLSWVDAAPTSRGQFAQAISRDLSKQYFPDFLTESMGVGVLQFNIIILKKDCSCFKNIVFFPLFFNKKGLFFCN